MSYIKYNPNLIGKKVILTEKKDSISGYFEIGTKVKITDKDPQRGYTFTDIHGNKVIEAGFNGFKLL